MPLMVTAIGPPAYLIYLVSGTSLFFLAFSGGIARGWEAQRRSWRNARNFLGSPGDGCNGGRGRAIRSGGVKGSYRARARRWKEHRHRYRK